VLSVYSTTDMAQQDKNSTEKPTGVTGKLSNVSLAEGVIYVTALAIALTVLGITVAELAGV